MSLGVSKKFQSKVLQDCMHLICHHPYLRKLWVKFQHTTSSLHWSMISDFECHQFCEQTLLYTQTLRDTLHESPEWWEPCDSWWHTWATLFQPDMVIGTHAGSMGASFSHYTGPTASSEQRFGALPSIDEVAETPRRYVYLAQPNSGLTRGFPLLPSAPQSWNRSHCIVPTVELTTLNTS